MAKVPIVKFHDNISGCDVDININNIIGIKNSFLLKSISLRKLRSSSVWLKYLFNVYILGDFW